MTLEIMARQARGALGHAGDGERSTFIAHHDLQAREGPEAHRITLVHRPSGD